MQLRVARLCLDCEELHAADTCPVCASESYAFLSTWLPSEERRRWRRPASQRAQAARRPFHAVKCLFVAWFGDSEPVRPPGPPRTRASDHVPSFDFDEPAGQPKDQPVHARSNTDLESAPRRSS